MAFDRSRPAELLAQWRKARRDLPQFGLVAAGIAILFALAALWDASAMPGELRAFVLTMNLASLGCAGTWFVSKMVVLPVRIELARRRARD